MDTGAIVTNVSSSIGYGFLSAFVDEAPAGGGEPKVWLFGSFCNRCPPPPGQAHHGQGCEPERAEVQAWGSVGGSLLIWETAEVGGTVPTFNVEVSRVTSTPAAQAAVGLPPHKYVMILEISTLFLINNSPDGDL